MALVLAFAFANKKFRTRVFSLPKKIAALSMVYEHEDEVLQEKNYLDHIVSLSPRRKYVIPETPDEKWVQGLIDSFNWRKCTKPNPAVLLQQWNESRAKHFLRMSIASGKPVYFRAMRVEDAGIFTDLLSKEVLKKQPAAVPLDALSFLYAMKHGFRGIIHRPYVALTSIDARVASATISGNPVMICRKPSPIAKRVIDGYAKDFALSPTLIKAKSVHHLVFSN